MERTKKRGFLARALIGFGWSLLGMVVLLAAAILYYRFDDPLTPEAQAALALPVKLGEISNDNGYVAMLGMGAPADEEQMAWGRKVAAALRANEAQGFQRNVEWQQLVRNHLSFPAHGHWCAPGKDCVAAFKAKQAELARIVKEQRLLLDRYSAARGKPAYEEAYVPLRIESALPNFGNLGNAHRLARFVIFARMARGDVAGALDEMEKEIAFHRRVLAGSRTLIGKMVAIRHLANDALALSELMSARRAALAPHAARIGRMLDGAEGLLDARPALELEIRVAANLLNELGAAMAGGDSDWAVESLFYRPHMTVNAMVASEREKLAAFDGDASGYDQAQARAQQIGERLSRPGWLGYLRNPVGSAFLAIGGLSPGMYVSRMHDTAALLRLVRLQAALLEKRADKPQQVLKVLAAGGGRRFADPYTGRPFALDAATNSVWFTARGRGGWQAEFSKPDLRVAIHP